MNKRENKYHFSNKAVKELRNEFMWADWFKKRKSIKMSGLIGLQKLLIRASLGI